MSKKIIIFSATSGSNLKLAKTLEGHATELGAQVEIINIEAMNLPLYTPAEEEKNGVPVGAKSLVDSLSTAGAYVLLAPEYNGTIPPVVSSAFSWMSRSGDEDWRSNFNGKFAVVGTHSGGGGLKVCQAMRMQLEHLGSIVLPRNILTSYSKELNPKSATSILTQLIGFIK